MEVENKILERLITNHTDDTIQVVEKLGTIELVEFLKSLPLDLSSLIFSKLNRLKASQCIEKADPSFAKELLENCVPYISANILRILDQKKIQLLLEGISSEHSNAIRQILNYPENSAGAYLDSRVFTLKENVNIGEALDLIRENKTYVQSIVFVLSTEQILVGSIELKSLITGDSFRPIRSIMKTDIPKIVANIDVRALIDGKIDDEELPVLPIVDMHNVFLGVIDKKSISVLKSDKASKSRDIQEASLALGDLYQIGLSSLFRSTSELLWDTKNK